jgi:hypothetical protein
VEGGLAKNEFSERHYLLEKSIGAKAVCAHLEDQI